MNTSRMNVVFAGLVQLLFLAVEGEASIFVTDVKMNKMIELNARRPHCRLHTDRGYIQSAVLNTDPLKIRQVPVETVQTLEDVCFEGNQLSGEIQGGLSFIYPGTLWCGPGNIAKNYSDLGRNADEDKCCRAHDNCYPQIAPGECLKSICNHGTFTRLHCECDEKFRSCLSGLNTEIANTLGAAFFNAIQVTCFDSRRPCSNLQRNECELSFYPARRFNFGQRNLEPVEKTVVAEARVSDSTNEQGGGIDPYSLQLILSAVYKNFVYRPLRTLGNFIIVTKVGFNETEQEEICSRYKFRPSSKFRSRVITYKSYT